MKSKALLTVLVVVVASSVLTGCTFRIPFFISPPIVGEWSQTKTEGGVTGTIILEFHLDKTMVMRLTVEELEGTTNATAAAPASKFTEEFFGETGTQKVTGGFFVEGTWRYDRLSKVLTMTIEGDSMTFDCEFKGLFRNKVILTDEAGDSEEFDRKLFAW